MICSLQVALDLWPGLQIRLGPLSIKLDNRSSNLRSIRLAAPVKNGYSVRQKKVFISLGDLAEADLLINKSKSSK